MRKSKIFIGSSSESLNVAEAVNVNLDHEMEVTLWRNGFDLSQNTLDSLLKKANESDFALFIFSPDDIALIRQQEKQIVRDNVLFELGLFIGAIGKDRCFILKPRNEDLHFPSDLAGLTYADYEANRNDGDLVSAVNVGCVLIKKQVAKIGIRNYASLQVLNESKPMIIDSKLNELDVQVLMYLLETYTSSVEGYSVYVVKNYIKNKTNFVDLSLIKLLRLNYIDKSIEQNYNGEPYISFKITELGIDSIMNINEEIEF
ncbi:MAG: nucleotide-binding protein [Campylobacterales bacterium]|nr:nucleotide-binding protein [Campylobacterales bacterium]MBN2831956.1 nucleotide-binding protein [Campylobacterales bacterium]